MAKQETSIQWEAVSNVLSGWVLFAMSSLIIGCSYKKVCFTHDDCLPNHRCDEGICSPSDSNYDKSKDESIASDTESWDAGLHHDTGSNSVDGGELRTMSTEEVNNIVNKIMERMSDTQKLGQMTQAFGGSVTQDMAKDLCFGSIFGFADSENDLSGHSKNMWAEQIDKRQRWTVEEGCGIPLLFGADMIHGNAYVAGATVFPHNIGLGATRDEGLVEHICRATAIEARAVGINLNFGPVLAVPRNIKWGRTYEGFGETPELTTKLAAACIRGYQGMGNLADPGAIAATAKHFVGDGSLNSDKDFSELNISWEVLKTIHMPPYQAAVANGVAAILAVFYKWNTKSICFNETLLKDYLKSELAFDGFISTDFDAIPKADGSGEYSDSNVSDAIKSGIDMAMISIKGYMKALKSLENPEVVDEAIRRILRIKVRMGLLDRNGQAVEDAYLHNEKFLKEIGSQDHMALARRAVQKSLVLLKNDNDVLPLSKNESVAIIGLWANSMGAQSGGWTITKLGSKNTTINDQIAGETIFEGMTLVSNGHTTTDMINADDKVVVVIGENPYAENYGNDGASISLYDWTLGPVASIELSKQPHYENLDKAYKSGKKVILIIISGRPLVITDEDVQKCHAIVAAWLPGSRGIGVADVLYGDAPFSGKLPHTWPMSADQEPINVNKHPEEPGNDAAKVKPRWEYGYGLTY